MNKAVVCFGMPEDRKDLFFDRVLDPHALPVALWDNVQDFERNALGVFTQDVREQIAYVVVDRSYEKLEHVGPMNVPGLGDGFVEQGKRLGELFPNAKVIYIAEQFLYLLEEHARAVHLNNYGGITSYARAWSLGPEGLAALFKDKLDLN